MTMSAGLRLIPFALVLNAAAVGAALAAQPAEPQQSSAQSAPQSPSQSLPQPPSQAPPHSSPAIGLGDSAGLRATIFGTPPQDTASLPAKVPLSEINVELPWR